MKYFKEIAHQDNLGFYRFDITTDNDVVIIKYESLPNGYKNVVSPDDEINIIQMNVKNIPAIISAFYSVFQAQEGDSLAIKENGDIVEISMSFNYERGDIDCIIVRDLSQRIKTRLSWSIFFKFDKPFSIKDQLPRIPTPAMVLFTDTLKQIHDEWEKQQSGGQGAQV
jgi:hypothetical protein